MKQGEIKYSQQSIINESCVHVINEITETDG